MPFDVIPQEVVVTPTKVSDFMEQGWASVGWNQKCGGLATYDEDGKPISLCAFAAWNYAHTGRPERVTDSPVHCAAWTAACDAFSVATGKGLVPANNAGMPAREIIATLRALGH